MRNVLAIIAGLIVGSAVNMGIIVLGGELVAPPVGVDVTDMESLKASMHLFEPVHFISPFLAHALGTLVGALVAAKLATSRAMGLALGIGAFFLLGGAVNAFLLPVPTWFIVVDLVGAYLPMAWIGGKLAGGKN